MVTYGTFQKANNKGADQTARMRRLVWACVVRKHPKTGFSRVEDQFILAVTVTLFALQFDKIIDMTRRYFSVLYLLSVVFLMPWIRRCLSIVCQIRRFYSIVFQLPRQFSIVDLI